ncbi:MAG TPA: TonB-dependent receptor [Bryobacteraceae bacterium]|nr:TonB-dependent receptor [Bryobacteraceae bacterium]
MSPTQRITRTVFSLSLLVLTAGGCFAQFETSAVLGTVLDAHNAAVPHAHVLLENQETGVSQTTESDERGTYQFLEVRVGRYKVAVEAAGFKRAGTQEFRVDVGARQRVDVSLEVGELTQTIEVNEAGAMVQSESSDRGEVISHEETANLPLNGRSTASLALLAPGVRLAYGLPKRESSFNVSGMRSQLNDFILDGLDNNAYGTSNQGLSNQVIQLSPDAVQQFKVITNSFSAEYGRVGGAVVNASVRSGTNLWHLTMWDYFRNTDLNAVGFFKPTGGQKPVYVYNQFGAAGGGPIRKNKMFLFADYEGFRRIQRSLTFASLPTMSQRTGDFSGMALIDPFSGSPFPNGVIPQSRLSKFGSTVFSALPAVNLPGSSNNFESLPPSPDDDNKGDIRYDHYLSSKIVGFSRYSEHLYHQTAAAAFPGPSGAGAGIISRVMNWQAAAGLTWTLNPTSILEFRFGASKTEGMKRPATDNGGPSMFDLYGITGLPTAPNLTGGLNTQAISGYSSLGRDNQSPQWQNPLVFNPKANYSKILSRHTLKIGYEFQAINTTMDDFNPAYGEDYYSGQFTNPTPSKGNTIYNLADFLLGARNEYQLVSYTEAHFRQRMNFAYVQDDFKVSPRLTLNLGVRYEFATPVYERDDHQANYDPATNSLVQVHGSSIADRALVYPDYKNFAPRVGLAYGINSKTAIRAGYGISYIQFIRQGGDSYLAYNGPFVVNAAITQAASQGLCAPGQAPLTCFRTTDMGYPEGFTSPANFSTVNTKTVYIDKTIRTPYVQNWHLTIQRELAKDLLLDVGYVGNHSVGLWVNEDFNQALPNLAGQNLPLKVRRPNAQFDYIDANFGAGFSSYEGLQVKLEKRYANGLTFLNSFTWSKAIDNASGALEAANGDFQAVNLFDSRSQKGLSGYDQPFNDTFSAVYDLPFGHSRRYASSLPPVLDAFLGGWTLSGINTMQSGQTINLTYDPNSAFIATDGSKNSAIYRPNIIGPVMMPDGQRTINQYFNPTNVLVPTDVTHPYGNAGRNIGRSDHYYGFDLGIHKQFRLPGEGRYLEFRTELFNALNKTNFSPANGDRSSSSFGKITSTFPARQVQLALRLAF